MLLYVIGGFILIVFILVIHSKRRMPDEEVYHTLEKMRTDDWQGWVEIANTDGRPLFQGKMVATAKGHVGALLIGCLLENNAMEPLVNAIKSQPFVYLKEGRILARCLTTHDEEILMTKLEDQDIITRLTDILNSKTKPELCLAINSVGIQHMDNLEGLSQFDKIWEDSLVSDKVLKPLPVNI